MTTLTEALSTLETNQIVNICPADRESKTNLLLLLLLLLLRSEHLTREIAKKRTYTAETPYRTFSPKLGHVKIALTLLSPLWKLLLRMWILAILLK